MAPRTAMQVMAEQQDMIKAQAKRIEAQDGSLGDVLAVVKDQQGQIERLTRGLQHLSQLAGLEHRVANAMGLRFVQADVQNPAQPVPEPPAVPSTESTEETKTPEAFADVQAPGLVPGSTNDVAADVTTTNYTPGQDVPAPAVKQLVDVTAPVDGTQTQRPLKETKTETDVRVGDPMNPQTAFPPQGGFAQQQRTSSVQKTAQQIAAEASLRTMSSLRLARLRLKAGVEPFTEGDIAADMALGQRIEREASLTQNDIEREIVTLDAVVRRQGAQQQRNPRLVPKAASGRQAPPMAGSGVAAGFDGDDSDLFM